MNKSSLKGIMILLIVSLVGLGLALAGSQNGIQTLGIPVFALAVGLIFIIQWLAFIPAFIQQTEKFFDITGSLTYIGIILLAMLLSSKPDARTILLVVLVIIWAGRLGTFLVRRIHRAGKDDRFDEIKPDFMRFLNAWTLQALWITFTLSAALAAITSTARKALDIYTLIGVLIWVIGFSIEASADAQKNKFRADPANQGKFIQTGLWSRSRHPNYFGEILLWVGVAVITLPILQGWQWVTLISPVFVTLLLTRISGIPMLEKKADDKWGGQSDYEDYKKNTPVLIPRL